MMTDPISDLLTRLRNGLRVKKDAVEVPGSRVKVDIAEILKQEGFIEGYEVIPGEGPKSTLKVSLKYGPDGEKVMTHLKRESKPGRRVYVGVGEIPQVLGGMGLAIVSTSRGLLSDRNARKENVGGELICTVW